MTVITKPLSGNKAKNQKEPLFADTAGDGVSASHKFFAFLYYLLR